MPEYTEVLACTYTIQRWLSAVNDQEPLRLNTIWVDATEKELNADHSAADISTADLDHPDSDAESDAHLGVDIGWDSQCLRGGSTGAHQPVYPPPPWADRPDSEYNVVEMLHTLVLHGVHATLCTVVLDLGKLFLQIQLHTHVTVQPYTREQWDSEISQVTSAKRGFRIGMALDFGEYILAFVTLDNIFTPHWGQSLADLPIQHADVYHEYHAFLSAVATWIDTHRLSKNTKQLGLAVNAVHGANCVFGGIGVYTIIEVFYLAGLSVFLTEYELFSCPSRIARFCEAFWMFAHHTHQCLRQAQRRCYSYWLHVYGKKATNMSLRMVQLRQEY
ncbi:hypothetical protein B0H21DRAFT_670628, partial [Amylocystis lapponica]